MICLYVEKGIPSQVGQKRLKFSLAKYAHEELSDSHDSQFFVFIDLLELPVKTTLKTAKVKEELLERLHE